MAWFRAASSIAKHAVRRNIYRGRSYYYVARTTAVPIPPASRNFHTTSFKSKAESALVPRAVPHSKLTDNFLDGTSSVYLEELQRAWEADPNSVDESWDNFFRNFVG